VPERVLNIEFPMFSPVRSQPRPPRSPSYRETSTRPLPPRSPGCIR